MGWIGIAGTAINMLGNTEQARSNLKQNYYTAGMLENQKSINDVLALLNEGDIYSATDYQLKQLYKQEKNFVASQKVQGAASGIYESKTMEDLINDTYKSIDADAQMLIQNRNRQLKTNYLNNKFAGIGLQTQADMYRTAGRNALLSGGLSNMSAGMNLLGNLYANNYQKQSLY